MTCETLQLRKLPGRLMVRLDRPDRQNSLNALMLREIHHALDEAERDPECAAMVIEGQEGVFCAGMDFADAVSQAEPEIGNYMALLRRFTLTPRIVFCKIDGRVAGGGVGLAAASDLVVATSRASFSLPEALWGLLPCCVLPYLLRRTGFQPAYRLALTTASISAAEAHACRLVDELSDQPDETIRKLLARCARIRPETVRDLKQYFRQLSAVGAETEQAAIRELSRLLAQPEVRENIGAFLHDGQLPSEKGAEKGR
jgi:polyketide biosynthesis enoyl-CoA hydratase PksH